MLADRPIRAAFITPSLYWGGAERWLHDVAKWTSGRIYWTGCAVTQPCFVDNTMKDLVGRYMPVWGYGRKAVEHVSKGADVLLAWGLTNLDTMAGGLGKPTVFVAHGSGIFDLNSVRGSLHSATHWAAVARMSTRVYAELVPIEKVTIVLNGIDPERCQITRDRDDVRCELGLSRNDFAVGYLGRLAPEKRPAIIAEAVACLPKRFKGVWVGDGWDQEKQKRTIINSCGSRAIFHTRVEDIGNYLQAFDCFVLASPSEGFSMAVLEAMLVGVPIVTTPVGAIPELREKHGQLWEEVPIGCTGRQLARAIEAVATTPAVTMKKRIALARAAVEENYLGQHMADRWVAYLEKIVEGG